jgi:benzoylformate decarboxylase
MLSDLPDDFRYVLALQEGAATGMADGYAQATGRPALVNLHAAAGTGNAMGNLKWSHEPARPQDAPQSLSKAILLATAAPTGPVYLSLPLDDWDQDPDASALGQLKSRVIDGNPVVPEEALGRLRERLAAARNPVMVAGPDIDTPTGWDGAVRLAENLCRLGDS